MADGVRDVGTRENFAEVMQATGCMVYRLLPRRVLAAGAWLGGCNGGVAAGFCWPGIGQQGRRGHPSHARWRDGG